MQKWFIIETSIDDDSYVNLVLADTAGNVQQITIRTADRDDDISISSQEVDNEFEFACHVMTREQYDALIR